MSRRHCAWCGNYFAPGTGVFNRCSRKCDEEYRAAEDARAEARHHRRAGMTQEELDAEDAQLAQLRAEEAERDRQRREHLEEKIRQHGKADEAFLRMLKWAVITTVLIVVLSPVLLKLVVTLTE